MNNPRIEWLRIKQNIPLRRARLLVRIRRRAKKRFHLSLNSNLFLEAFITPEWITRKNKIAFRRDYGYDKIQKMVELTYKHTPDN